MSVFQRELAARLRGNKKRRVWVFVPYDQLTSDIGPLGREDPEELGIVVLLTYWNVSIAWPVSATAC